MKAHRKIWLAAWQQARNQIGWWWAWALLGVMLVVPLAFAVWHDGWIKVGSAELGLLSFCFWMMQFTSLWQQNHPHAARLVPGHARQLRQVLIASWLGLSLFNAALLGSQFGHAPAWGLGCAVLLFLMAVLLRWPQLWLASWLLGVLMAKAVPTPSWRALGGLAISVYQQGPWLSFAAALLLLAWPLSRLLQTGGPAHRQSYAKAKRLRMAMDMRNAGKNQPLMYGGRIGIGIWRVVNEPLVLWRQHLIKTARPTERSVLARAELALGAHWTHLLSGLLVFGLVASLGIGLAHIYAGVDVLEMLRHGGIGITMGLASMVISPALGLPAALYASRREQALLMLLPGMPRGAALNRRLARRRLLQFGSYWTVIVCLLLLVQRFDATADAFCLLMAALPLGLLVLRDWSRLRQPGTQAIVLGMLGWLLAGGALLGLQRGLEISPWWSFPLIALATLGLGVWRWRRLSGYSQAFPVGRWA